ncbi:primosomal protein N' [Tyzzerella sp. An114]|uniref:primosomal protein N' n=1 Tax=Tyzzerella sp. An114 TaxID=1965545 RepID=UPI000B431FF2|nr:primosomal protein N' [Tyzzerella sp. An114]OUQ58853.1 primosomal protein N' [Tyzzerella sp. An114]
MEKFANIIININHSDVDRIFDYKIPKALENRIKKGMRVIVPFGNGNKKIEGYVIDICENTDVPSDKIKSIIKECDDFPIFSDSMLKLAFWLKEKYYTTLSSCLKTIMPSGIGIKSKWLVVLLDYDENIDVTEREKEIIEFIFENNNVVYKSDIETYFGKNISNILNSLKNKKIIAIRQSVTGKSFEKKIRCVKLNLDESFDEKYKSLCKNKRCEKQKEIVNFLIDYDYIKVSELKNHFDDCNYSIKSLKKKGIVTVFYEVEKRDVFDSENFNKTYFPNYTDEQLKAIEILENMRKSHNKKPVLLFGVTGSGKTEVYMSIIESIINEGKQAIVLVPEISLTPQIVGRFISRFGDKVSFTHSRMNQGERFDQWKKAREGEICIMIGPRSALFTPFSNIGVIIIDEEHESSYKSDTSPKYDTVETAKKLSEITDSLLVLGSATPDICTYYKCMTGEYDMAELKHRANDSNLPQTFIKDMRLELEMGNRSIFSRDLYQEIKLNLEKGEQTMLFINRRGFSTFVSCRKCGHVMMCDNCNVSYTYHSKSQSLMCHYCGKTIKNPTVCPECGSRYIKYFGTGTQKVEDEVKKYFPNARVLRMDMDTTTKKNSHEKILSSFGKGEADILIGTQMIAKGHDFPNVTLVGIIAADISLNSGSYKAAENTFQLLTQVSGRAGRSEREGRVYIQTYNSDNYVIRLSAKQDYKGFYDEEIAVRRILDYPPFGCFFNIMISGEKEREVIESSQRIKDVMSYFNKNNDFIILGPVPAFISKIKNEYRFTITVKYSDEYRLKKFVLYCIDKFKERNGKTGIYINITMNRVVF